MPPPPDNNGLHLAPQEIPAAPAYARNSRNRHWGRQLWWRVRVEGKTCAQAWVEVFPDSKASNQKIAYNMCSRFLKWYEAAYPETLEESGAEFDLGPHSTMSTIRDMLEAVVWRWNAEKSEYVPMDQPDHKARAAGVDRLKGMIEMSDRFQRRTVGAETPTDLQSPPKIDTPQEFETWAGGPGRARAALVVWGLVENTTSAARSRWAPPWARFLRAAPGLRRQAQRPSGTAAVNRVPDPRIRWSG